MSPRGTLTATLLAAILASVSTAQTASRSRPNQNVPVYALRMALRCDDPNQRLAACYELGCRGRKAEGAVEQLLAVALNDGRYAVQAEACRSLGKIGVQTDRVVCVLSANLKREYQWQVRYASAQALGWLGAKAAPAVDTLIGGLDDSSRDVRWACADALGRIGSPAKKSIPYLRKLAESKDSDVARAALKSVKVLEELADKVARSN